MHELKKLYVMNAGNPDSIYCTYNGDDEATIYIYDAIGAWPYVNAVDFIDVLSGIKSNTINVRINSPGGDVFEARAIKTALEQHPAKVVAHIDGLAASAASFVMLAADEIRISSGAMVMIHRAWGVVVGDANECLKQAAILEKIDSSMAGEYAEYAGGTPEKWAELMDAETWFTSDECVAEGLAHSIAVKNAAAKTPKRFDLSMFSNTPETLATASLEIDVSEDDHPVDTDGDDVDIVNSNQIVIGGRCRIAARLADQAATAAAI